MKVKINGLEIEGKVEEIRAILMGVGSNECKGAKQYEEKRTDTLGASNLQHPQNFRN
ncbi:hypothetical protein RGU74_21310 [Bacillus cereus]|uniref:hypothetical protein n=1 Tax=Bacillus cereus TaxID=1396 RepID=UPI0028535A31|nr:hypothetical protein [Bacillus cereus]MDR4986154.1 hypothetical protein [Bacillus cereus]